MTDRDLFTQTASRDIESAQYKSYQQALGLVFVGLETIAATASLIQPQTALADRNQDPTATPDSPTGTPRPSPTPTRTPTKTPEATSSPTPTHEATAIPTAETEPKDAQIIRNGPRGTKILAITIDDGGNSSVATAISIIKSEKIKVTFCPIGNTLSNKDQQALMKEAFATGLVQFCNHTDNHNMNLLNGTSDEEVAQHIKKADDQLSTALGFQYKTEFVRPPGGAGGYGEGNPKLKRVAGQLGKDILMWDGEMISYLKGKPYSVENVKKHIMNLAEQYEGGNIILLHFNAVDMAALKEAIPELKAQGFTFGFVDDLFNPPSTTDTQPLQDIVLNKADNQSLKVAK